MEKIIFKSGRFALEITAGGTASGFIDKKSGVNYCRNSPPTPFAGISLGGRTFPARRIERIAGGMVVFFEGTGATAEISVAEKENCLIFEAGPVRGAEIEEFVFADIRLNLECLPSEPFAATALALNINTNVPEMPGLNRRLRAAGYGVFGVAGARAAFIGCQPGEMRRLIKEVIWAEDGLPHSPVGGPCALDSEKAGGSALFDLGDISESNVEEWIALMKKLRFEQVEFHGAEAKSFRFGDFKANTEVHPRGWDSFKAIIERLHDEGLYAILHTYSFCIDPACGWVTPVPDPRLAKGPVFTLAEDIDEDSARIPVEESVELMSEAEGEYIPELDILQNSLVLQIDEELIKYGGISGPFRGGFTGCSRGFNGTRKASHRRGARVQYLKKCFGLFFPDGDSTLFTETAAKTAEFYNYCGFDMIYLDALDAEAAVNGRANGWHYGAKFAFELFKRLEKPALMEMATFHHHLWYLRSRTGAWDSPSRGFKRFIDFHAASNEKDRRIFMPGQFGWWRPVSGVSWSREKGVREKDEFSVSGEIQFVDDIEYLCAKALAAVAGLTLSGIVPRMLGENETLRRKVGIINLYERLRLDADVPSGIKERLARPWAEYVLKQNASGRQGFHPARYLKEEIEAGESGSRVEPVNPFESQPLRLRIEALYAAGPFGAGENGVLVDFCGAGFFNEHSSADGVRAVISPGREEQPPPGGACAWYEAENAGEAPSGAWASAGRSFSPPLNFSGGYALGVWILGDGLGEVINFQLRSPLHVSTSVTDRCVTVDFTGWKYFSLVEPGTEHFARHTWPYRSFVNSLMEFPADPEEMDALISSSRHLYRAPYHMFSGSVDMSAVSSFSIWYNNLPPGRKARCCLSRVEVLPVYPEPLRSPSVRIGSREIIFPADVLPGQYIEFNGMDDCALYSQTGRLISKVTPEGAGPVLEKGKNQIFVKGKGPEKNTAPRARLTVIAEASSPEMLL